MQHHSTQRQEAASAVALVMTVVNEQEPTPATEPFRLHVVANKVQYKSSYITYRQSRRSTIDDNGGSYEGL